MKNLSELLKEERGVIPVYLAFLLIAVFLLLVVFGPGNSGRLGFLSREKEEQKSYAQTPIAPPPGDSDQDGFTDEVEKYIRTDPSDNCPDNNADAAWPPDLNNNRVVNQADADLFKPYINKKANNFILKRFDLNQDGLVTLADVIKLNPYMNKVCPFHYLAVETSSEKIQFSVSPKVDEGGAIIAVIDLTAVNRATCDYQTAYDFSSTKYREQGDTTELFLYATQDRFAWLNSTSPNSPRPGHRYCSLVVVGDPVFGEYAASEGIIFTVPADFKGTTDYLQVSCTLLSATSHAVNNPFNLTVSYTPTDLSAQFRVNLFGVSQFGVKDTLLTYKEPYVTGGKAMVTFDSQFFKNAGTYWVEAYYKGGGNKPCGNSPVNFSVS